MSEKMKLEEKESRQDAKRESQKDRLPRNRFGTCVFREMEKYAVVVCSVSVSVSGVWGRGGCICCDRACHRHHSCACRVYPRAGGLTVLAAVRARLLPRVPPNCGALVRHTFPIRFTPTHRPFLVQPSIVRHTSYANTLART